MSRCLRGLVLLLLAAWGLATTAPPDGRPRQRSHLKPRPGFKVELVAVEPLIRSPVAFDWGPDGRLWVVEMRDYPLGLDGKGNQAEELRSSKTPKATASTTKPLSSSITLAFRQASWSGARA